MKTGEQVLNISKITFEPSKCFKHFQFLSYLFVTLHVPWPLADGKASKVDKVSFTHSNSIPSYVFSFIAKGNIWEKIHFDILGSTNYDTKTLIWLSTKINKLHYLGFCSFDIKSKDRSRKLSINIIHCEKLILRFLVLHLQNSLWLFVFLEG